MSKREMKKVKFLGIEGMDYKPMETAIAEVRLYGMALIEHPDGYFDEYLQKNVLYVDVKKHITVNFE
jgi:hypothetical protein